MAEIVLGRMKFNPAFVVDPKRRFMLLEAFDRLGESLR